MRKICSRCNHRHTMSDTDDICNFCNLLSNFAKVPHEVFQEKQQQAYDLLGESLKHLNDSEEAISLKKKIRVYLKSVALQSN